MKRTPNMAKVIWIAGVISLFFSGASFADVELEGAQPAPDELALGMAGKAVPAITTDEVKRGQKGHGLSVFAGSEPELFTAEVIGVLRNSAPELNYILARLSGKDLERSGVVAGMSGSPVYFDGRLAGAVSFGYAFGLDAIAGIMPIGSMRELSRLPLSEDAASQRLTSRAGASSTPVKLSDLLVREQPVERLQQALVALRPPAMPMGRAAVQWSAAGFGEQVNSLLSQSVGSLTPLVGGYGLSTPAGGGTVDGPKDLLPGSAVAAFLVTGDLNLAIHGTVTDRDGDHILAFGHPVFGSGPLRMPMATAEVVTIIANQANSFKVSNAGQIIGAFDQDRQAGVHGLIGGEAPMFPVSVRVRGLSERDYHVRMTEMPELLPSLLAITALGAVNSATYSNGNQGIDLEARFELTDFPALEIRQSFDGDQAVLQSVVYLLSIAQFLQRNELERVAVSGIEVTFEQSAPSRMATLISARAAKNRVAPGETVPITLELQPYRGERYRQVVDFKVPEHLAAGRVMVLIGDGASMDGARLAIEDSTPETIEQNLRLMRSFHSRRDLLIFAATVHPGLTLGGEVLPDLPPSMRSILSAAPSGKPIPMRILGEQEKAMDRPIDGLLSFDLTVERESSEP